MGANGVFVRRKALDGPNQRPEIGLQHFIASFSRYATDRLVLMVYCSAGAVPVAARMQNVNFPGTRPIRNMAEASGFITPASPPPLLRSVHVKLYCNSRTLPRDRCCNKPGRHCVCASKSSRRLHPLRYSTIKSHLVCAKGPSATWSIG